MSLESQTIPTSGKKIVVLLDHTTEVRPAIIYAARLVEHMKASLVLMHIVDSNSFEHWFGLHDVMQAEALQKGEVLLERSLKQAKAIVTDQIECIIRVGSPLEELSRFFAEDPCVCLLLISLGSEKGANAFLGFLGSYMEQFSIPVILLPKALTDDDVTKFV